MASLSWFLTKPGLKATRILVFSAAGGAFTFTLGIHGYFLDKYKAVVQMYQPNTLEEPLNPEVKARAAKVLEECRLPVRKKKMIDLFTVYGFDVFHAGSTYTKGGAIIGIPKNYTYKKTDDVETDKIQGVKKEFSWLSKSGQQFKESLVLSEKAQKFSIAKEIYFIDSNYVNVLATTQALGITTAFFLSYYINTNLNYYARPRSWRLFLYGVSSVVGYFAYAVLKDLHAVYVEKYAVDSASSLGKDYVLGGIEYYETLLKRNCALRDLLGKEGEKTFTKHGNLHQLIRTPKLPLTQMRDSMKSKLEVLEKDEMLRLREVEEEIL